MNRLYAKTAILNTDGTDDGKFVSYDWVLSSLKRNHYQYAMSLEVLKSFRAGLKANTAPVLTDHLNGVNNIIGRMENPRIRGNEELLASVMLQKGLPDVHSDAIIDRINAGTLTDGSIGFDWNEAYFKCDLCNSDMQMQYGFVFDDNGHFLGEKDDKGQMVTAVLYGNPTIYEFSLVAVGADPGAEIVNGLQKIMTENGLGTGALKVAASLNNLSFSKLCDSLSVNPNGPDADHAYLEAVHNDLTDQYKALDDHLIFLDRMISRRPTAEEFDNLQRKNAELQAQVDDPDFKELIRLAKQGEDCVALMREISIEACKAKLIKSGVTESNVKLHADYKKHVEMISTVNCVDTLHRVAMSDYMVARVDFNLTSLHVQREAETKAEELSKIPKRTFITGINDIR